MPAPMSASWILSLGDRGGAVCASSGFKRVAVAARAAAWMNFLRSSIVKRVSLSPLSFRVTAFLRPCARKTETVTNDTPMDSGAQRLPASDDDYPCVLWPEKSGETEVCYLDRVT